MRDLEQYIEDNILPKYDAFDEGHRQDHIQYVIDAALSLSKYYNVNKDIIYVAAAYHDIGMMYGRENHHIYSSKIIKKDKNLLKWFSKEEINIIADAAEDHRASSSREPRTIYGKIIAEADRQIIPEVVVRRAIQYSLKNNPSFDKENHWKRVLNHLKEKYGDNGYMKLWIPESPNAKALESLRELIINEKLLRLLFEKCYICISNQ